MNSSPARSPRGIDSDTGAKRSVDIHRTALVDPRAEIGSGVSVGPHTIVGPDVTIGSDTSIGANCLIDGWTGIGSGCRIFHSAVIGVEPQDTKYRGEKSYVRIGNANIIREFATIHRATGEGQATVVGEGNFIMAYAHIAHNCVIGNGTVIANAVNMGGHVTIEDHATVGGITPVHQFVRIGSYSFIGGGSRIAMDIVPYVKVAGSPPIVNGLNVIGLRRRGFSAETMRVLKRAYKLIFRSDLNVSQALERIKSELPMIPEIIHMIDFIEKSERGITL